MIDINEKVRAFIILDEELARIRAEIEAIDEIIKFMQRKRDQLVRQRTVFVKVSDKLVGKEVLYG